MKYSHGDLFGKFDEVCSDICCIQYSYRSDLLHYWSGPDPILFPFGIGLSMNMVQDDDGFILTILRKADREKIPYSEWDNYKEVYHHVRKVYFDHDSISFRADDGSRRIIFGDQLELISIIKEN